MQHSEQYSLSVILAAGGEPDRLHRSLESMARQTSDILEIIILASGDIYDAGHMAEQIPLRIIHGPKNAGSIDWEAGLKAVRDRIKRNGSADHVPREADAQPDASAMPSHWFGHLSAAILSPGISGQPGSAL